MLTEGLAPESPGELSPLGLPSGRGGCGKMARGPHDSAEPRARHTAGATRCGSRGAVPQPSASTDAAPAEGEGSPSEPGLVPSDARQGTPGREGRVEE